VTQSDEDAGAAVAARLRRRLSALRRENAELRQELGAFDAAFFEEIEDLKLRYAEAARKCRAFDEYVALNPPPLRPPSQVS
jgi:hypothetical protein